MGFSVRLLMMAVSLCQIVPGASSVLAEDGSIDPQHQWSLWRGPLGTGVAPHGDPPVSWSEEKNVRWKTALPGKGHSTPIVWGDKIFVTASIAHGKSLPLPGGKAEGAHHNLPPTQRHKFVLMAIDRNSGKILWQRVARDAQPREGAHSTGSWASNSAVTDGRHVVASFGSNGLYAYSTSGELLWERDLGDLEIFHGHGEGSSPALFGKHLIVNWDHQGDSFLTALDVRTGQEIWKVERDEITSWSTPLVVEHAGEHQVIVSATGRVRGYDLKTGAVLWECGGLSRNVVATPVAADGYVYVGNSYDQQAMMGIRLDKAKGDITGTDAVVWRIRQHTPYVPSPLLYDDMLFFIKHNQGLLSNLEAKSGRPHFGPQRLPGIRNVFASPVGAAGRIYIVDRYGAAVVLRRGAKFEVLARNQLDDSFSASPAIVGKQLFLRGTRYLYCIEEDAGTR